MPSNNSNWGKYIDAAHRKVAIAKFHNEKLNIALQEDKACSDRPSIPIQAFFEGVVVSTVAAIDQVAQAANSALNLRLPSNELFDGASSEIEKYVPKYKGWREKPIGIDLRRIRTRIVHYSYIKDYKGELSWHVESTNSKYEGSRDLSDYSKAVIDYADELNCLAKDFENLLLKNNVDLAKTDVK